LGFLSSLTSKRIGIGKGLFYLSEHNDELAVLFSQSDNHRQLSNDTFLSEQINTSHQPNEQVVPLQTRKPGELPSLTVETIQFTFLLWL
jgi:hypothetical protein